ncbi:alpha-N-acetylglucosaminidase isoform X1 [Patella vulgata]|uniref:alpha-N-acetylglucosaminidase isoform X1 n=2 Tax=Patella vulgata TaxID=6465 RepID=UPI0024A7C768|nr:alpha-N-acetylglucosaminidase isoform X1 [Patella vulgata]
MIVYQQILVISLFVCILGINHVNSTEFDTLKHLKAKTSAEIQTESVKDLIKRVLGSRSSEFNVTVDFNLGPQGKDTYKIITENGVQKISGSTGVAVAMGFYYYIKYYCNGQYTWAGKQVNLPVNLPTIPSPGLTRTTLDRFRYYQNVCTVSYSLAWLNWTRWERHIDWMALQGINLPLAFTGQEAIFQRVYMNLGYSFQDLEEHFGGPAFLAWARMGNIRGWGGPLPSAWITDKLVLQHKILDRMRSLGMIPVLPGFAGHVPAATTRLYPNANITRLSQWGRFGSNYSETYILDFEDPLFIKIGSSFIREMKNEFGVDHIYNADSFNEMTPRSSEASYLASASRGVYQAMIDADPQAIWLMQGWLFLSSFWGPTQIEALLTAIPKGRMIVLDLYSELRPIYSRTKSYYGQPFIWCMLHNFGGTMELYGALDLVNKGPFTGRNFVNSTMIGTGITPEGIFQNEVVYEFMNENAWRTEPRNISQWISDYARQRYGQFDINADKAWQILQRSVYAYNSSEKFHGKDGFIKRPRIKPHLTIWYKPSDLYQAWEYMVMASTQLKTNELFRYDLVDVTRNSLQVISMKMYSDILTAYKIKNITALQNSGDKFIKLLTDVDLLLASDTHFLLSNWIGDALAWATDIVEGALYEYNARNQITLWGPDGQIVDYASKQWAGLFMDYYKPRWQLFIDTLINCVKTGETFNSKTFESDVLTKVEKPFTFSTKMYPRTPTGDSVSIASKLYSYYRPSTKEHDQFYKNHLKSSKMFTEKNKNLDKHLSRYWNEDVVQMQIDL